MPQPSPPSSDVTPREEAAPTPAPGDAGTDIGQTQQQAAFSQFASFLAPPQASDELGRLGNFRVLRLIGEGGMGFVFEGQDLKLERRVAIKVMRPEVATMPEAAGRFLREAKTAAALASDHVVSIYHVDEQNGVPFLVMPLMAGETLNDRLKSGPIPIRSAVRIARECAEGLAAAHAAGLVHRDIKPANLWLERGSDRVKILDFGLARAEAGGQFTKTGQVLGTPHYMSPEQARGKGVDGRADLFSLGVVLYRMTTGQQPFTGEDMLAVLSSLAMDEPAAPAEMNPAVPPALSALILRLLAKSANDRPPSAEHVAEELRTIEGGETLLVARPESAKGVHVPVAVTPIESSGLVTQPDDQVSLWHRRLLTATSPTDLQRLLYEVEEHRATRPHSPDVKLLRDQVRQALSRLRNPTVLSGDSGARRNTTPLSSSPRAIRARWVLPLLIVPLVGIAVWLLRDKFGPTKTDPDGGPDPSGFAGKASNKVELKNVSVTPPSSSSARIRLQPFLPITINAGSSIPIPFVVERENAQDEITLDLSGAPVGVELQPRKIGVGGTHATLKLTTTSETPVGTSTLIIGALAGTASDKTDLKLTIHPAVLPKLLVKGPETVMLKTGEETSFTVSVERVHVAGAITLEWLDLPAGIRSTGSWNILANVNRAELTLSTDFSIRGPATAQLRASIGDVNDTMSIDLQIERVAPPILDSTQGEIAAATVKRIQQQWADYLGTPASAHVDLNENVRMSFMLIPPGQFNIAAQTTNSESRKPELPDRVQKISSAFYMGKYEVTQEEYWALTGTNPSRFNRGIETRRFPVETITYREALEYCSKIKTKTNWKAALPTDKEWEYACRAGTTTPFYFGTWINTTKANIRESSPKDTPNPTPLNRPSAVGTYESIAPHPFGLCDMHGNVWEWTDGLRGGAWAYDGRYANSSHRERYEASIISASYGFRVVLRVD